MLVVAGQFRGVARAIAIRFLAFVGVILAVSVSAHAEAHLAAHDFKMAGDETRVRVVLHFDREPDLRWFLLRAPHRLVLDLPATRFDIDQQEEFSRGIVTGVSFGNLDAGRSRMIFSSEGPFTVERIDVLENETSDGHRVLIDIVADSERAFESALADQLATTGTIQATPKGDRPGAPAEPRPKRFTIMIDAGHGGIDTGAKGVRGTLEKTITLAFALELRKYLQDHTDYDVLMTRDSDVFLRLDERVRIARQHEADLLLSIHADAIRLAGMRGATVYTVSDRASDAEAAAKAIRENLADQVAGIESPDENQDVADILVDLVRRETQSFSMRFARSLVGELSNVVEMVNNPHRSAGFRVLKAPDVPSVLLELGYISNRDDEAQLRDPEWRAMAIRSIASAVDVFAGRKIGAGG